MEWGGGTMNLQEKLHILSSKLVFLFALNERRKISNMSTSPTPIMQLGFNAA